MTAWNDPSVTANEDNSLETGMVNHKTERVGSLKDLVEERQPGSITLCLLYGRRNKLSSLSHCIIVVFLSWQLI